MPVEGVCYAGLEDISKLGKKVLAEHFHTGDDVPETTVSSMHEASAEHSWLFAARPLPSLPKVLCLAVWRPL